MHQLVQKNSNSRNSPTSEKLIDLLEQKSQLKATKKCVLNYLTIQQLISFLENNFGFTNSIEIAKNYTENIFNLIEILNTIHSLLKKRSIKNRITRLCKKLQNPNLQVSEN